MSNYMELTSKLNADVPWSGKIGDITRIGLGSGGSEAFIASSHAA